MKVLDESTDEIRSMVVCVYFWIHQAWHCVHCLPQFSWCVCFNFNNDIVVMHTASQSSWHGSSLLCVLSCIVCRDTIPILIPTPHSNSHVLRLYSLKSDDAKHPSQFWPSKNDELEHNSRHGSSLDCFQFN